MWKTWEERSVSVFTHLNSNEDQKQPLPMTIKKWYNVATVTVMSLTMLSVNSSKKQDLSSQAFHQTTVWSKSLKSQKTNSLLLANTTQNCQAVQTAQKDFTQPLSQRQLKTTIANKNQGSRLKYLLPFCEKMTNSEKSLKKILTKKSLIDILVKYSIAGMAELADAQD